MIAKYLPSLKENFIILLYIRLYYMVVSVKGTREKGDRSKNENNVKICVAIQGRMEYEMIVIVYREMLV